MPGHGMFLFDTCALIDLTRPRARPDVLKRFGETPAGSATTSSLVLMELRRGTARLADPEAAWKTLDNGLLRRLTVIDFTATEALAAADTNTILERRGRTLPLIDLMIGVTSLVHGLTLVTRNLKDFIDIPGLKVENWFQ